MHQGKVKNYDDDRKFGFIFADAGGELFFHRSALMNAEKVSAGDRVSFEMEPSDRRPGTFRASQVTVIE
jgi:cold shock CspA family protein